MKGVLTTFTTFQIANVFIVYLLSWITLHLTLTPLVAVECLLVFTLSTLLALFLKVLYKQKCIIICPSQVKSKIHRFPVWSHRTAFQPSSACWPSSASWRSSRSARGPSPGSSWPSSSPRGPGPPPSPWPASPTERPTSSWG